MDIHNHAPADVSPQELSRAQNGWANFTKFGVYNIVAIIGILVLMAIFLL